MSVDGQHVSFRRHCVTYLKVVRGGTPADTAGDVVVAAVAGAEPAAVVTRVGQRHATQMGAHADRDQPLKPTKEGLLLEVVFPILEISFAFETTNPTYRRCIYRVLVVLGSLLSQVVGTF
jgi:hypothetical protein